MALIQYPSAQRLAQRLGILHPIIQAPMGGGFTPPSLVAAVSNAGGLGSVGAAYLSPEQIQTEIRAIRKLTDNPFNVNLFTGGYAASSHSNPAAMISLMAKYHAELGLEPPHEPKPLPDPFPAQLEVIIAERVPVFSFTFGLPQADDMARLKAANILVIGTATTVAEAIALEACGVDVVVAQGSEAGAHRGTFLGEFETSLVGTLSLVPQMVDAVSVPVIAAGGIMDGRGIAASFALGAAGAQLGTAFLTCTEAGTPNCYKQAILTTTAEKTTVTRAYSGRPARGIINQFMQDMVGHETALLPFPLQNELTRPMRKAATALEDTRYMSLWAGQSAALARQLDAASLIQTLVAETVAICNGLQGS